AATIATRSARVPSHSSWRGESLRKASFYSDGLRLAARLYLPEGAEDGERRPGVVVAHGFGGTMRFRTPEIAEALAARGFLALIFDYRGFGESEGPRHRLLPLEQVEDV